MNVLQNTIWQQDITQQFCDVLCTISDRASMQGFLSDVMTEKEINEMSARLQAAKMLKAGSKYTEIIATTGLSSRTVARISDWMQSGNNGYDTALMLLAQHHSHMSPARA